MNFLGVRASSGELRSCPRRRPAGHAVVGWRWLLSRAVARLVGARHSTTLARIERGGTRVCTAPTTVWRRVGRLGSTAPRAVSAIVSVAAIGFALGMGPAAYGAGVDETAARSGTQDGALEAVGWTPLAVPAMEAALYPPQTFLGVDVPQAPTGGESALDTDAKPGVVLVLTADDWQSTARAKRFGGSETSARSLAARFVLAGYDTLVVVLSPIALPARQRTASSRRALTRGGAAGGPREASMDATDVRAYLDAGATVLRARGQTRIAGFVLGSLPAESPTIGAGAIGKATATRTAASPGRLDGLIVVARRQGYVGFEDLRRPGADHRRPSVLLIDGDEAVSEWESLGLSRRHVTSIALDATRREVRLRPALAWEQMQRWLSALGKT